MGKDNRVAHRAAGGGPKQVRHYAPNLVRFLPALLGAAIASMLLLWTVFVVLAGLQGFDVPWLPHWVPYFGGQQFPKIPAIGELIRTAITICGFFGAVFAGVYAYRRQRVSEAEGIRADAELLSRRFQDAAEQLGHARAPVRFAGVFALSRLADEWPSQRQVCIDVLCAYYRMWQGEGPLDAGEVEVRQSILIVLLDRMNPGNEQGWHGHPLDLRWAIFESELVLNLTSFSTSRVDFRGAQFKGCKLSFEDGIFEDCALLFDGAVFSKVVFDLSNTRFNSGTVQLAGCSFRSVKGDLSRMVLQGGELSFAGSDFSDCHIFFSSARLQEGLLSMERTTFCGGSLQFNHVDFGEEAMVSFGYIQIDGTEVSFERAKGTKPQGLPVKYWPGVANPRT
jgi:hypothetical protein